ncbi:antibiotic biosynthesis monooxygenase family protein [Gracilimonas mengyeensis]|uniref:Antibiotic biosynthesis monooxygenase n=1 Tax=Gracilimonas mengyeensis TaxID=1302730 RepID=A0A521BYP2_9BACT|nr:antibiotic biosynthesis monooxygenase [Gracilimonas mengyeensis]SMO52293.1 hypothetical protein SAMN06265219_10411 [Gracilimonas mengyeensis]
MITRIWHGWTSPENADAYEQVLYKEVIPGIEAKNIEGFQKIEVLRQEHQNEVEFVTIMYFDDLDAVKDFMGGDYKVAHVPAAAQKLLKRYNKRSEHYQLRKEQAY